MEDSDRFHGGGRTRADAWRCRSNARDLHLRSRRAPAPMAHDTILDAYHLARNGVEIVLVGPTRESFRQTALGLPGLTTMFVDCPT